MEQLITEVGMHATVRFLVAGIFLLMSPAQADQAVFSYQVVADGLSVDRSHIHSITARYLNDGSASVSIDLTPEGRDALGSFLRANLGQRMNLIVDGRAISEPIAIADDISTSPGPIVFGGLSHRAARELTGAFAIGEP